MCNIEGAPLGPLDRGCFNLSLPHLEEMCFLLQRSLRHRAANLLLATLDPDDLDAGGPRHGAGKLAEAGTKIDHPVTGAQARGRKAPVVQEPVHRGQALLFCRVGPVSVVRRRHAMCPYAWRRAAPAPRSSRLERARLVGFHQPSIADDIGGKDGSEATLRGRLPW